jgi:GH25 family lysozyme M1 (1,4-beta-N-acetylmuramidase)
MAALRGQPISDLPTTESWGVDVAEFNSPDYAALAAAGCAFAVLRAMTGSDAKGIMREDSKFRAHLAAFERVKIPVIGAYAWLASSRAGVEQARLMRSICDGLDVFRALDHEPAKGAFRDPTGASACAVGFARELECDGRTPPVYTGQWALTQAPLPTLGHCPLWLSHFGLSHWPAPIAPWSVVTLWQCGYVDPNAPDERKIDKNVFRGTLADLRKAMG